MFDKYIGLPYKNLGRDFKGVDCFGLIYLIYLTERNILLPDFSCLNYQSDWYKEGESIILDNLWADWYDVKEPLLYDCIVFYDTKKRIVNHIGMSIDTYRFIHITEGSYVMITKLNNFYISRIHRVLRYKGE